MSAVETMPAVATRDRANSKTKAKKMTLSEFYEAVPTVVAVSSDLPTESTGQDKDGVTSKRWIAEWDGEVVGEVDVPLRSAPKGPLDLETTKRKVRSTLEEYFHVGDIGEAVRCVREMQTPDLHFEVVKRAVILGMELSDKEREMTAVLISSLYVRNLLDSQQVAQGFDKVLEQLDDLILDIPDAVPLLAHFVADAILDGCLPTLYLTSISPELLASSKVTDVVAATTLRLEKRRALSEPSIDLEAVKSKMTSVLVEYFEAGDMSEVARRLREIGADREDLHHMIKLAITLSMDRGPAECEMASQLISGLFGRNIPAAQVARAFELLIERAEDMQLDNPNYSTALACFMARATMDECLPPSFLSSSLPKGETGRTVISKAQALLSAPHSATRISTIWGASKISPVDKLKATIKQLIQEYFISGDAKEALACVKELQVPQFHHEVVKQMVVLSTEGKEREQELVLSLLTDLCNPDSPVISNRQLRAGFERVLEVISDLVLDAPSAPQMVSQILSQALKKQLVDATWLQKLPDAMPAGPVVSGIVKAALE